MRLIVELKSRPSERPSTLKLAVAPMLRALFVASTSSFSLARLRGVSRGSALFLFFLRNSLAKWSTRTWSSCAPPIS